jgi:hypothetical protein
MVSGFLTSPLDHMRIESAVARPIFSWSKLLTSSIRAPSLPLRVLAAGIFFVGPTFGRDRSMPSSSRHGRRLRRVHASRSPRRLGEDLDVEAQGLHLLDEHLEALGDARLGDVLALDDGLVDLHAAEHVVGLDRQQLLQAVGAP